MNCKKCYYGLVEGCLVQQETDITCKWFTSTTPKDSVIDRVTKEIAVFYWEKKYDTRFYHHLNKLKFMQQV